MSIIPRCGVCNEKVRLREEQFSRLGDDGKIKKYHMRCIEKTQYARFDSLGVDCKDTNAKEETK